MMNMPCKTRDPKAAGVINGNFKISLFRRMFSCYGGLSCCTIATMTKKTLGILVATSVLCATPAQAATFIFNTDLPSNSNSIIRNSSGITLTVDTPVTGYTGPGVNTNSFGLCTWLQNSSAVSGGKRCGYTDTPSGQSATLTGLSFTFDQSVFLKSFDFTSFSGSNASTLTFSQGTNTQTFNLASTDSVPKNQTFLSNFLVSAGIPLLLSSDGTLSVQSGEQRINSLTVTTATDVPGPLPILGVIAAFSYARKLRKKTLA